MNFCASNNCPRPAKWHVWGKNEYGDFDVVECNQHARQSMHDSRNIEVYAQPIPEAWPYGALKFSEWEKITDEVAENNRSEYWGN